MLDRDGYRPNVGIILVNSRNEVFWGKRVREHSWQFPQGGIKRRPKPQPQQYYTSSYYSYYGNGYNSSYGYKAYGRPVRTQPKKNFFDWW